MTFCPGVDIHDAFRGARFSDNQLKVYNVVSSQILGFCTSGGSRGRQTIASAEPPAGP